MRLVERWRSNVVFSLPLKVDRAWRRLKIFSSCVCVCVSLDLLCRIVFTSQSAVLLLLRTPQRYTCDRANIAVVPRPRPLRSLF